MSCNYRGVVDVEKLQLQKSCNYDNVVIAKVLVGEVLELWRW